MGKRFEVLSPAGDEERLDAALDYGADAVYLAKKDFGMRAGCANFDDRGLADAVRKAHDRGVKVHLTCNTLPSNSEIAQFEGFIKQACDCGIDAAIVADMGVMSLVRRYAPDLEIHMSTQTGVVNYETARVLHEMGAKRVVLARELSLEEIAEIRAKTPPSLDIECFVHGAMCVSFSGRCLISSYLTGRDANRGRCAQPCRWGYHLMEETRPGQYFPVYEDEKGTFILNSKDLCMIEHLDRLAEAGVTSFKIEGRAKSAYYVAVVTNAYRMAADILEKDPENYRLPESVRGEVYKVSHREYCTGFYFGDIDRMQHYEDSSYIREWDVCAVVTGCDDKRIYAVQRNKFYRGDTVEILAPGQVPVTLAAEDLRNEDNEPIEDTRHAAMTFSMANTTGRLFPAGAMIRKDVR